MKEKGQGKNVRMEKSTKTANKKRFTKEKISPMGTAMGTPFDMTMSPRVDENKPKAKTIRRKKTDSMHDIIDDSASLKQRGKRVKTKSVGK